MQEFEKIIVIAIDTLNVDHLGCYGYSIPDIPTTPFVDSLAGEGALFLKHYATDVPTPSSFTSLFYGIRGIKHGTIGFNNKASEFHSPTPHLAECFSQNGFRTGMISNLLYPCPWLAKGFQDIYPPGLRFQGGSAEEVTDESSRWLEAHGKEKFFLFVHYWDPHCPYFRRSQKEYRRMFPATKYKEFAPDMEYFQGNKYLRMFYDTIHTLRDDPLHPADNLALYDANIRYVDDNIQRLLNNLPKMDVKQEDTLVVITSDHGEAFGEYGFWDHWTCYRNISQLPLIVVGPGVNKVEISDYTQNIDVMPTILELAGLKVPEGLCGRTMTPLFEGNQDSLQKEIVINSDAAVVQRMYVKDDYALVHSMAHPVWDHIKEYELFDLSDDPNQLKDLSSKERDRSSEMRIALGDWLAEELTGTPDPLQLSVFRGGWMWKSLCHYLESSVLEQLIGDYPELKRILKAK